MSAWGQIVFVRVPEMIDYNGNEDAVDGKCEVIYIKYGSNVSALFYPDPIRA